jgi:hypothetical protein
VGLGLGPPAVTALNHPVRPCDPLPITSAGVAAAEAQQAGTDEEAAGCDHNGAHAR